LVVSGVASHVIAPLENPKVFDPIKDFTHIAILGGPPIALAVNSTVSATDVKSFISMAKATPQGISWGSPGQGTHGYLIGEAFEVLTKTPMQHIAYKGAAPAVADLVAGHIPASFTTLSTAATQVKSGKVRLLAASSSKRLPAFPDVPTFTELGYPTLTGVTWFSLSGPPGMSPELVARLNAAVRKVMSSPQAQEQLIKTSMETFDFDVPRFNQFIASEIKQWAPMVKQVKAD
jgi:tripartite-type tricarboxylate transporter receptor subunit TctC